MLLRIAIAIISILLLIFVLLKLTGYQFLLTAFKGTYLQGHSTANINDHRLFETAVVSTSTTKPWPEPPDFLKKSLPQGLIDLMNKHGKPAAFLVVKNGQLVIEKYFENYNNRSQTNSFSMAKTVTTLITGIAIKEGYIESLDQKITDFLPEFSDQPLAKDVTVRHLSAMNSGYEWEENYYGPFSPTVQLYYDNDVPAFLLKGKFTQAAGDFWYYSSASTQLLGEIINRALKKSDTSFAGYLSKKVWQPLGMNDNALWHTDKAGNELTYCCLNTNARNFAKLGQLMLNKGYWQGEVIIPEAFIDEMIEPLGSEDYGLSTWLAVNEDPHFYWFSGHLGQYIIVVPEENMIVVQLNETRFFPEQKTEALSKLVRYAMDMTKTQ